MPAANESNQSPATLEIDVPGLTAERRNNPGLVLLDCREPYEWREVRIPGSLHIPMNDVPARLDELAQDGNIVVVCAHGVRSYTVASYLQVRGFKARSLAGGLALWQAQGGETESDLRRRR
ncbi:MAG: rhodanese-like domain-containing protein [Chloroflexi bacterium]|nr:rhodanese-like domain-containing protein [Chloroflexota bacterium]